MTVPKWLIPVLASIAALAVGVAGALLGMRFTPPVTEFVDPETIVAPVLEPIGVGEEPPAEGFEPSAPDGEGPPAEPGLRVSEAVAEREVPVPGSVPGGSADPSFVHFTGLLESWPDALLGSINLGGDALIGGGDPCAPREGEPPADCPPGVAGAILFDGELREFAAGGQAFPPTSEEYRERGNPYGGSLWCDGLDPAAGEVPFGILSTMPGSFLVRYWPTDDPGAERARTVLTTDAQRESWQAEAALGDEGFPIAQHCFILEGIEPDTAYTAVVVGTDDFGRRSPAHTTRFNSAGAPVHPGLQLTTVGDNLVLASALARDDETVDIRLGFVEPGTAPSCDAISSGRVPLTSATVRVGDDEIVAVNAPPGFRNKTVTSWAVAEGSTAIACARWFPAGGAPAWESAQPSFESVVVLQAPDRLSPRLTLFDVSRYDEGVTGIDFRVASSTGVLCSEFDWRPEYDATDLPRIVCDGSALAFGGTEADGRDRLSTRGFTGELVIEATVLTSAGPSATTTYLLPAGDAGSCRGSCETPPRSWFRVALDDVVTASGLCGSSFGAECTPPTETVASGTATFSLDWNQGSQNGVADWIVSAASDRSIDYVEPDFVQIDTGADAGWTLSDPSVRAPYSLAALELDVDRPVSYRLTLTNPWAEGAELGVGSPGCNGGAPLQASGESAGLAGVHTIRAFPGGLCLGTTYYARLELTDEEGRTTVYDVESATEGRWWGGMIVVGKRMIADLRYDLQAQTTSRSHIRVFEIEFNGVDIGAEPSQRCTSDGIFESHGFADDIPIYNDNQVTVRIFAVPAGAWGDASLPDGCRLGEFPEGAAAEEYSFTASFLELLGSAGVTGSSSEVYAARLRLAAVDPEPEASR